MLSPKVIILRAAGTNCDQETAFAFQKAGGNVELVHINQLMRKEKKLDDYQLLAIPGGFTYGDDIAAGKLLANELKYRLKDSLQRFREEGKLIIGICNGFQVLVRSGLLPRDSSVGQEVSLTLNDSGRFEARWVYLKTQNAKRKTQDCVWIKDLPEIIYLPVAHGEGKFVTQNNKVLERMKQNNQIVFQYCNERGDLSGYPDNPNGSQENIAGICDESGRVLGLMPHPERHIGNLQHPRWTGLRSKSRNHLPIGEGDGLQIFKNGVEYARKAF